MSDPTLDFLRTLPEPTAEDLGLIPTDDIEVPAEDERRDDG